MHHDLRDGEVIVGYKVAGKVGDEDHSFFGKPYKIAARLDSTGMGFDTSVFLNMATARKMIEKLEIAPLYGIKTDHPVVSTMMVNVKSGFEPRKAANEILFKYAMDYNLDMIMTKNMLQWKYVVADLNAFSYVAFGVAGLLWITAWGVLALVFSMIVNERKREFGLLRILGASKKKLNRILLTESLMVSTGGALCGLFLACLVLFHSVH